MYSWRGIYASDLQGQWPDVHDCPPRNLSRRIHEGPSSIVRLKPVPGVTIGLARDAETRPSGLEGLLASLAIASEEAFLCCCRAAVHPRPVLEPHEDVLRSLVAAKSSITLAEIRAELEARGIVVAALSTILLTLRRLGLRHKKKTVRAAEQDRPDVAPAASMLILEHVGRRARFSGRQYRRS